MRKASKNWSILCIEIYMMIINWGSIFLGLKVNEMKKKKLIINKFFWVKHFREKKINKEKKMTMMIDYVNDKSEKINDNNSKENHF